MHHYRAFTQFAALLSPIEAERKRNAWTMASTVDSCNCKKRLEARVGIEPTYKGFADLSLTTWVPRQTGKELRFRPAEPRPAEPKRRMELTEIFARDCSVLRRLRNLERETGFEPATSTLARSHS